MTLRLVYLIFCQLSAWVALLMRSEVSKTAVIMVLRHQMNVLQSAGQPSSTILWGSRSRSPTLSSGFTPLAGILDQATKSWTACDPFAAGVGHGVSRWGLAKAVGAVRSAAIVVPNVLAEHHTHVPLTEDQHAVGEFGFDSAHEPSTQQFARGQRGGIPTTRIPTSARTASTGAVNWPARSQTRNRN